MSIETLQHLECEIARLYALQAEALVAVASADRVVDEFALIDPLSETARVIRVEDAAREEVAAALRWSLSTADRRIQTARLLAGPLGQTKEALAEGEITMGHVTVIAEAAGRLPGAVDRHRRGPDGQPDARALSAGAEFVAACAELQRRVLPTARTATLARTRQAARRAVLAIDSEGERRRRERARCTRDVYVADGLDGISTLVARMATTDAHAVMAAIDAVAHIGDHPELTVGERRVEALVARVLGGGASREAPVRAHIDVVIDLPTLLGLADHPAHLQGAGPIASDEVRDLLTDPRIDVTMRRLVADPITGHLLDVGRRSYVVPGALRAFLVARDGTCRFPGCARGAERCQIDHATAWADGGRTDEANLGALCVRHHQLKTHAGWDIVRSQADGSCTWRSPRGRIYERRARPWDPLVDPPPF